MRHSSRLTWERISWRYLTLRERFELQYAWPRARGLRGPGIAADAAAFLYTCGLVVLLIDPSRATIVTLSGLVVLALIEMTLELIARPEVPALLRWHRARVRENRLGGGLKPVITVQRLMKPPAIGTHLGPRWFNALLLSAVAFFWLLLMVDGSRAASHGDALGVALAYGCLFGVALLARCVATLRWATLVQRRVRAGQCPSCAYPQDFGSKKCSECGLRWPLLAFEAASRRDG